MQRRPQRQAAQNGLKFFVSCLINRLHSLIREPLLNQLHSPQTAHSPQSLDSIRPPTQKDAQGFVDIDESAVEMNS